MGRILGFCLGALLALWTLETAAQTPIDCATKPFTFVSTDVIKAQGVWRQSQHLLNAVVDAQQVVAHPQSVAVGVVVSNCANTYRKHVGMILIDTKYHLPICTMFAAQRCMLIFVSVSYLKSVDTLSLTWMGRDYVCRAVDPMPRSKDIRTYEEWRVDINRCRLQIAERVGDRAHAKWLARLVPPHTKEPLQARVTKLAKP